MKPHNILNSFEANQMTVQQPVKFAARAVHFTTHSTSTVLPCYQMHKLHMYNKNCILGVNSMDWL